VYTSSTNCCKIANSPLGERGKIGDFGQT